MRSRNQSNFDKLAVQSTITYIVLRELIGPLISPIVFLFLPFLNIFGYRFLDHFGVHPVLANVYDIKSSLMLSRHKPQPESMLTWIVYSIWLSTLLS